MGTFNVNGVQVVRRSGADQSVIEHTANPCPSPCFYFLSLLGRPCQLVWLSIFLQLYAVPPSMCMSLREKCINATYGLLIHIFIACGSFLIDASSTPSILCSPSPRVRPCPWCAIPISFISHRSHFSSAHLSYNTHLTVLQTDDLQQCFHSFLPVLSPSSHPYMHNPVPQEDQHMWRFMIVSTSKGATSEEVIW